MTRRASAGSARWEETRRFIAAAVERDGDLMDVGCANGLLLETLAVWCRERGHAITPPGIDFVAELVERARDATPRTATGSKSRTRSPGSRAGATTSCA